MPVEPGQPFARNGPNGDPWVANQLRLDRMPAPFGAALFAAAAPRVGERCGVGARAYAFAVAVRSPHRP